MTTAYGMAARALLACGALMGVQVALADVTVVYETNSGGATGTQTILYADKQHVRVDMADARKHKTSMLKLGDKVYAITGKTVQDLSQLSGLMASMGGAAGGEHGTYPPIKYEDTGRTETIAGIVGEVYRFVERGKEHEVVLGEDKDLESAVLGSLEIAKAMSAMTPPNPMDRIQEESSLKGLALLRLDNDLRLQSVNRASIQDSAFTLPAKPQQFGAGLKGIIGR